MTLIHAWRSIKAAFCLIRWRHDGEAPTDAQIAHVCNGIYEYPGCAKIGWDHLVIAGDDAFAPSYGIKQIGDVDCIIFWGSTTTPDWLRDFRALADVPA